MGKLRCPTWIIWFYPPKVGPGTMLGGGVSRISEDLHKPEGSSVPSFFLLAPHYNYYHSWEVLARVPLLSPLWYFPHCIQNCVQYTHINQCVRQVCTGANRIWCRKVHIKHRGFSLQNKRQCCI